MRIKFRKKIYIFGLKAKIAHRKAIRQRARDFAKMAKAFRASQTDSPIDIEAEFQDLIQAFVGENSPLVIKMTARERIITVTSFIDELLKLVITLKMAASRGSFPSKTMMNSVFEGTTVLSGFGDRIAFGSAFGLIPAEIKGKSDTTIGVTSLETNARRTHLDLFRGMILMSLRNACD